MLVTVENGDLERALRVLKRKMRREGIVAEVRAREAYQKPGDVRRRKRAQAVKRHRKAEKRRRLEAESATVAPAPWWSPRQTTRP